MSDPLIVTGGQRIEELSNAITPMDQENTYFEIEQKNLTAGTQSRRLKLSTLMTDVVNKAIDALTIASQIASNIDYDNLTSGLSAVDVQSAINELAALKADITSLQTVATTGDYSDLLNRPTLGTAAPLNTGTGPGEIPINSNLGTASLVDTGIAPSEVPTNADLGTAAAANVGTASNEVPINADLPDFSAYGNVVTRNTGTDLAQVPTNNDLLVTENYQTGDYVLQVTDINKVIAVDDTIERTVTIPNDGAVAIPIGSIISVYCVGFGNVNITGATGVTVRNEGYITQFNECSLRKRGANEWVAIGTIGE